MLRISVMLYGSDQVRRALLTPNTGLWRATMAAACLMLLTSCGGQAVTQNRFEEACKAEGYAEGSEQMADCVERRWARQRYMPKYGK
jgi:hypothetical protein